MPFEIVRNDITRMHVDAIVNAANERLLHGGGVCGAIFAAAGPARLQAACDKIGHCDTGSAVATPAFALPARHVIHAVGPIWHGGHDGEEQALRSCYRSALLLANELGDSSIAFPLISSGIYGYPKDQAIDVAIDEIRTFLTDHDMDVYLAIFDSSSLRASKGRFAHIVEYINDHYVEQSHYLRRSIRENLPGQYGGNVAAETSRPAARAPEICDSAAAPAHPGGRSKHQGILRRMLETLDASFSETLFAMIDERGLKDSEVYKRANMSRQHFSKIRNKRGYHPKKQTVLALAVALELTLDETRLLLERAGYAMTHADERDVIVEYYIGRGDYDIYEINLALYAFDQPLLG